MTDQIPIWTWITLIALGSLHGINPGMGWLFAVALGIQKRNSGAVVRALGPIVFGHALSILSVAIAVLLVGAMLPQSMLAVAGGMCMLCFAAWKVATRFRHKTRFGMRVNARQLAAWSFVMASAHGAGLMLVPPLLALRNPLAPVAAAEGTHQHHLPTAASTTDDVLLAVAAVGVHSIAMLAVTALVAMLVYRWIGVDVLKRAWINIDRIWIGVMILAGLLTTGVGLFRLA